MDAWEHGGSTKNWGWIKIYVALFYKLFSMKCSNTFSGYLIIQFSCSSVQAHPPNHTLTLSAALNCRSNPQETCSCDALGKKSTFQEKQLLAEDRECRTAQCEEADDPSHNYRVDPPNPQRSSLFSYWSLNRTSLVPLSHKWKKDSMCVKKVCFTLHVCSRSGAYVNYFWLRCISETKIDAFKNTWLMSICVEMLQVHVSFECKKRKF